jgi:hypothetical protein
MGVPNGNPGQIRDQVLHTNLAFDLVGLAGLAPVSFIFIDGGAPQEHEVFGQNCFDASIGFAVFFCIHTPCQGPSQFSRGSPFFTS